MDGQGGESGQPMRGKHGCTAVSTRVRALLEIFEGEKRILGFVEVQYRPSSKRKISQVKAMRITKATSGGESSIARFDMVRQITLSFFVTTDAETLETTRPC